MSHMAMASLKLLFPCKKLRRSSRLEIREKVETKAKTIQYGPLGYFEILPLEMKFVIFTYLPVEELSVMTIVSKAMRNMVELYRNSTWGQHCLLPRAITHQTIPVSEHIYYTQQFQRLGLLLKRSTCLHTTRDRLRLIQLFLQKYLCNLHKCCAEPTKCLGLVCYGKFLHTVIAGWDDKECVKVYETITANTLMQRHLQSLVKFKPGHYPTLELHVRLFFRRVFINQCTNSHDRSFWLSTILKPFPMVHQARILFLLFGPLCGDEIPWHEVCENTPASKEQASVCFGELANAFKVLYHHATEWTEDDIISVIDELTSLPDEWLSENTAHLLYLCGDCIVVKVLSSKAINGRITELAGIMTSLCLVCVRYDQGVRWVIDIISQVCAVMDNSKDKLNLLYSIVDIFREYILDLHEFGDSNDEGIYDLEHMLEAQGKFIKEIVTIAFQNMIINR